LFGHWNSKKCDCGGFQWAKLGGNYAEASYYSKYVKTNSGDIIDGFIWPFE